MCKIPGLHYIWFSSKDCSDERFRIFFEEEKTRSRLETGLRRQRAHAPSSRVTHNVSTMDWGLQSTYLLSAFGRQSGSGLSEHRRRQDNKTRQGKTYTHSKILRKTVFHYYHGHTNVTNPYYSTRVQWNSHADSVKPTELWVLKVA